MSEQYYPCADITGCGPTDNPNSLSWNYQSCTQVVTNVDTLGLFGGDMFASYPYNFTELTAYCNQTFGTFPDAFAVLQAYPLALGSRIIYSNGLIDGWSAGGLHVLPTLDTHLIFIAKGAHHLDLRGSDPADPQPVIVARNEEK